MEARALADRWASATPNDPRPHENLGRALLRLGEFEAATTALQRAATLGATERRTELFWDLLEALVKSDRGADARRLLDDAASDPGRDTTQIGNFALAGFNALLGRYRPPPVDSAALLRRRARIDSMLRSLPPPPPPPPTFSALLAAGDTAAARTTLARMDAHLASLEATRSFPRISPSHTQSAEYHLALGDTAVAEARLAEIERPLHEGMFRYSIGLMYGSWPPWLGRAWLLTGDVAAARGRPEEARRMYRRIIGLWGGGDADLQHVVDQARARLDSLSGR
jgi:tetratricopeptide (TPR) repeat protein